MPYNHIVYLVGHNIIMKIERKQENIFLKIVIKSKNYYFENRDRLIKNRDKIKRYRCEYFKIRREKGLNFEIAWNLRSRTNTAFKCQNVRKTNKTIDLLGCSHSFFRSWIIHQLYGTMTIENYGPVWQRDHCLPMGSFNLWNENDMKKCFNWVILRPMFSTEKNSKTAKIDHYLQLRQEVKANYFMKLNVEEGFNENVHC